MSTVLHAHPLGLTWVESGEPLQRASHALRADGRVWLIDPVDREEPLAQAAALGEPAGVLQLLDRHPRDCAAIAGRLGVAHLRLPDVVPGSPFEVLRVVDVPRWRERGLWWAAERALVVPEGVGTVPYFTTGTVPVGVHPFLRLRPPHGLLGSGRSPEHLLVGHGAPLHGPDTAGALRAGLGRAWRDLPRVPLAMLRAAG